MSDLITKAVVSYVVERDIGPLKEGEVYQLDAESAAPLLAAKVIREASDEEVNGGEEEVAEEAPEYVEAAAQKLATKNAEALEKAALLIAEKLNKPAAPALPKITVRDNVDPTFGYKSFGEFAMLQVKKAHGDFDATRVVSEREKKYVTKGYLGLAGGPTVTSTDGGNLVPPSYADQLFNRVKNVTNLTDFTTDEKFSGNTLEVPVYNDTSPSNGVISYWTSEGNSTSDSKPNFSTVEIKLNNLVTLVNVSDYLLEDNAYALESFLNEIAPRKMIFELNKHVLYGTGNGANVISNAATVAVTRNTASHIYFQDIIGMYRVMSEWNLDNAKWYVSPSIMNELMAMAFPSSSGTF